MSKQNSGSTTPTETLSYTKGGQSQGDSLHDDKRDAEYATTSHTALPLASQQTQRAESALGDAVLRWIGVRKVPPKFNPDEVSVRFDSTH